MYDDFDEAILDCGHSVNLYKSIGKCTSCRKRVCERCLQGFDGELLCPLCFHEKVEDPV